MFKFKTKEEKEMLADYNRAGQDMRDLQECIDQLINTVELQAQAIKERDNIIDGLHVQVANQELELNIRATNDLVRSKMNSVHKLTVW